MVHDGIIMRHSQEELSADNRILSALFQASPLAIIALDTSGNVTRWSKAAESIFGWEAGEVLGKPSPFIPAKRRDEQRHLFEKTLHGEELHDIRLCLVKKNGELLDVRQAPAIAI